MSAPTRIFTIADQRWFAGASGDVNPLHLDPVWAAAVFPGEVVVHGLHVLLWGLGHHLAAHHGLPLHSVRAIFLKPVLLGDEVRVESAPDGASFKCLVGSEPMVVVQLHGNTCAVPLLSHSARTHNPATIPRDWTPEQLAAVVGDVVMPETAGDLSRTFPVVAAAVGERALRGLAALSTLVGMQCPGLRGMLSEFSVSLAGTDTTDRLQFRVKRYDAPFSRVEMDVAGLGLAGTVSAFAARIAPPPPSDDEIRSLIGAKEFFGQHPLIVGASSGLGEITARLLAAGGAEPTLTWHQSRDAAEQVAAAVSALNGRCNLVQLDAAAPVAGIAALATAGWNGEQLYYFSTPRIFRRRLEVYQRNDLRNFLAVYVDGFYEIVRALMVLPRTAPLAVFYPSSIAVDEQAADLLEYRIAKLAGEHLCVQLQRKYKYLSITIAHLPRIATRQTQTLVKVKAESPQLAMLPYIRKVQGKT